VIALLPRSSSLIALTRFQAGCSGVEHNQPSVANALLTVACTNAMSPHFPTDAKRNIVSANRQCTPDAARDAKASEIAGNDCATDTKGDGRPDAMATCNGCENKKSFKVTSQPVPCAQQTFTGPKSTS
jgi:hypothetical protein